MEENPPRVETARSGRVATSRQQVRQDAQGQVLSFGMNSEDRARFDNAPAEGQRESRTPSDSKTLQRSWQARYAEIRKYCSKLADSSVSIHHIRGLTHINLNLYIKPDGFLTPEGERYFSRMSKEDRALFDEALAKRRARPHSEQYKIMEYLSELEDASITIPNLSKLMGWSLGNYIKADGSLTPNGQSFFANMSGDHRARLDSALAKRQSKSRLPRRKRESYPETMKHLPEPGRGLDTSAGSSSHQRSRNLTSLVSAAAQSSSRGGGSLASGSPSRLPSPGGASAFEGRPLLRDVGNPSYATSRRQPSPRGELMSRVSGVASSSRSGGLLASGSPGGPSNLSAVSADNFRWVVQGLADHPDHIKTLKDASIYSDAPESSLRKLLTSEFELTSVGENYLKEKFDEQERSRISRVISSHSAKRSRKS
jgi:hypothetical protein